MHWWGTYAGLAVGHWAAQVEAGGPRGHRVRHIAPPALLAEKVLAWGGPHVPQREHVKAYGAALLGTAQHSAAGREQEGHKLGWHVRQYSRL